MTDLFTRRVASARGPFMAHGSPHPLAEVETLVEGAAPVVVRAASAQSSIAPGKGDDDCGMTVAVVAHSGREFLVSEPMAKIFVMQALRIIRRRASELVVLVHAAGVELLSITPITPFTVSTRVTPAEVPGSETKAVMNAHSRPESQPSPSNVPPLEAGKTVSEDRPADVMPGRYLDVLLLSNEPNLLAMASMPLRVVDAHGRIITLQTVVVYLGDSTYEIQLDGRLIGFIRRTGQTFTTHAGLDITDRSQSRQWLFWDKAATFLVHASGHTLVETITPEALVIRIVQDDEYARTSDSDQQARPDA